MLRTLVLPAALCACAWGCAASPSPQDTARQYAQALNEGRVDDAWALVAPVQKEAGLGREAFAKRYSDPAARAARADAAAAAAKTPTARLGEVTLTRVENGWRIVEPVGDGGAKKTLLSFLDAAERGDFEAAYALLGEGLRARYTPDLLERDFENEPLARERLERARLAAEAEPVLEGDLALFTVGDGRAVRLRREPEGFRVVALE